MEPKERPPTSIEPAPARQPSAKALAAAAAGAVLAVLVYRLLVNTGRPGTILAACPGLAVNLVSGQKSYLNGAIAAGLGLSAAVFAEWFHYPFPSDESFSFYLQNLKLLGRPTLNMLAVGTAAGFFFGTNFFKPSQA